MHGGWRFLGGGFCEADGNTTTQCMRLYNFADMSVAQKQEFGVEKFCMNLSLRVYVGVTGLVCGATWQCKEKCEEDFRLLL